MHDKIAASRLACVPAVVRARLMARRVDLPNGAVTVVARFYTILAEAGDDPALPKRASFEAACKSESTLGLLLRVLEQFAPEMCLAEGRGLRRGFYRARSLRSSAVTASDTRHQAEPRGWPNAWKSMLPAMQMAPITESTLARHIASINRCADLLPILTCPPRLGWLLAWEMARTFREEGLRPATIASYLGGLVSLASHGGADTQAIAGLRSVQAGLLRETRRVPKLKQGRIEVLYEKGGYAEVVRAIVRQLDRAAECADWREAAETARATAAILAITLNVPPRSGDIVSWVYGEALVREPHGTWHLRWQQEKTGVWLNAGTLWPEVGWVIDEHLLGGRPPRYAHRRYTELIGMNWLSHEASGHDRRWPSERVSAALGVPLHDLRTLAADYLRLHDPATAAGTVSALLGHSSREAGAEYRAISNQTIVQRGWLEIREMHASGISRL